MPVGQGAGNTPAQSVAYGALTPWPTTSNQFRVNSCAVGVRPEDEIHHVRSGGERDIYVLRLVGAGRAAENGDRRCDRPVVCADPQSM
jgi:hypothetical protein